MIGRYEEDGETGLGKVRGKIYELSLGDESGLYGIADTQFTVYDGQEFAIIHQITGNGHSEVLLNAKQIAKLFEIVDDRLAKHEKARGDLINSAAFDPDGEA